MDADIVTEIQNKLILHWNYRNIRELPQELRQEGHHVAEIYLKSNLIERLPLWLGELKNLTNLYLNGNQLKSLPYEIDNLESLFCLDVGQNHLVSLPSTIGKLKHLNFLCASRNYLTCLPEEIWELKSLKVLILSNNLLTYLSESVLKCSNLEELCLDENNLTRLPQQIVYLPNLDFLSVAGNHILYLPALPFVSSPRIYFERNPFLNYLTYCLGSQLSIRPSQSGNMWHLETFGCFEYNAVTKNPNHFILNISNSFYPGRNQVQLVMPYGLQSVCNAASGIKKVPSMYELSIRTVYKILQNKLEDVFFPYNVDMHMKKGPTAICGNPNCNVPIFTFAFVWIIPKYVMNSTGDVRKIMSTVFFCSDHCSSYCTDYNELKGSRIE